MKLPRYIVGNESQGLMINHLLLPGGEAIKKEVSITRVQMILLSYRNLSLQISSFSNEKVHRALCKYDSRKKKKKQYK